MEDPLQLYHTLVQVLGRHENWLDIRHLKTLVWMVVGLIQSGKIGLNAWAPYVHSRATYTQSTVRRCTRWMGNPRIHVLDLYGPLIQQYHKKESAGCHVNYREIRHIASVPAGVKRPA